MKTRARSNRSARAPRGAFTLVELMVVITIMAALMALTAAAVLKFLGTQQATNTQSTLDRVQSQLNRAWSKVKDQAYTETIPASIDATIRSTLANAAGEAPNVTTGRVRVIYVKLKLRAAFPMNFAEAFNIPYYNSYLGASVPQSPVPSPPAYTTYLNSHGINVAAASTASPSDARESSVCLLMALQRAAGGAGIDPAELTAGGAAGDYNGMPCLMDAWGRPIFFARFPTGALNLNPSGPLPGANDPGDPQGFLNSTTWQTMPQEQLTFSLLTLQQLAQPSNPPMSYKLAPMVASGGPSDWTARGTVITPASAFNPINFAPVTGGDALFSTP